jgi:hypothetical protein
MAPARIRYAYLKGQTWLYRRNYPKEVAALLGQQALKQSLKTSDAKVARLRAAEVNASYEDTVQKVLLGAQTLPLRGAEGDGWASSSNLALARLRSTLELSDAVTYKQGVLPKLTVKAATRRYLILRQRELRPSGFKSVRYSVELFRSKYSELKLSQLTRDQGREFLSLIARLSPHIGKSERTRGLSLEACVNWSDSGLAKITCGTACKIDPCIGVIGVQK